MSLHRWTISENLELIIEQIYCNAWAVMWYLSLANIWQSDQTILLHTVNGHLRGGVKVGRIWTSLARSLFHVTFCLYKQVQHCEWLWRETAQKCAQLALFQRFITSHRSLLQQAFLLHFEQCPALIRSSAALKHTTQPLWLACDFFPQVSWSLPHKQASSGTYQVKFFDEESYSSLRKVRVWCIVATSELCLFRIVLSL